MLHCVKSVQVRVISGPYFPVFGLNTEIYYVNSVFSPNTGNYGPKITQYLDTFRAVIGCILGCIHLVYAKAALLSI